METDTQKRQLDEDLLRTWLDTAIKAQRRNVEHPDDPYMEKRQREKTVLKSLGQMAKYLGIIYLTPLTRARELSTI